MATIITCDGKKKKCGKPAVGKIHVDVWAENVADQDRPTGVRLSADSCDDCRPAQMADLLKDASAQLERDIPRHKTMIAARREEEEAQTALAPLYRMVANQKAAKQDPSPEMAAEIERLEKVAREAAGRYADAFAGNPVTTG